MTPPEKPETKTDSSPTDAGSSAPPPWQRVASDVQRAFEHTREAGSETVRVEPVDASSAATAAGSPPAAAPAKTTATASETAVPATQGGADTPGTAAGQSGAGTETAPKTTVPKTTVPANKTVPEQKTTVTENKPTPRNRDAATVVSPLAPGRPAATPAPASAPRNRDAKTERFEDWGYTKARKSTPTEDTSGTLPTAETPEVGGYAGLGGSGTSSVYAGQRVGSLPRAESGIRTSVNLGTGSAVPGASTPIRPASPPNALRRPGRGPRRASLQVRRVDPWSVLKLAFVLSVALFFVWMVAVGVLYGVHRILAPGKRRVPGHKHARNRHRVQFLRLEVLGNHRSGIPHIRLGHFFGGQRPGQRNLAMKIVRMRRPQAGNRPARLRPRRRKLRVRVHNAANLRKLEIQQRVRVQVA